MSISLSLPPPFARLERRSAIVLTQLGPTLLRLAMGLVFLGFGLLKVVPGISPAEGLAVETFGTLSFGLVPDDLARLAVAAVEITLGVLRLTVRLPRLTVALLGVTLVGILSPLVLAPAQLFAGPFGAPTLEGQYVLKDLILAAAAVILAGDALRRAGAHDQPGKDPVAGGHLGGSPR